MSLFKAREFWSLQNDSSESYDTNCFKISALNNSETDYIIIGSHSGLLQIFKPSTEIGEDNILSCYKPSDLCIEILLDNPILQLEIGKLVSGSTQNQLAILHPSSIGIYSYATKEGIVEHGHQNIINLLYEHKLRRCSANFVLGPFGGSKQRDFICIQSLDGLLSFFEQETFSFCCFLPNFLIPGPLVYILKSDGFVTFSSNWCIEHFSYKKLSEVGETKTSDLNSNGKKLEPDWSYNLSEGVLQINSITGVDQNLIVILGERNLYCLEESGALKFMKKLDFSPSCLANFMLEDNSLTSLIVSETNTLLIYQNTTLKWSAQLSFLPIAIGRINLSNVKGALVLLSEEGQLQCIYLGTEPFLFSAPPLANTPLDFKKTEQELSRLYKTIANNQSKDQNFVNANAARELSLTITVNPHLEKNETDFSSPKCGITVDVIPQAVFEEINIVVHVEAPLKAIPSSKLFKNAVDKISFQCFVFPEFPSEIPSLDLQVVVTFITSMGVPRVVQRMAVLPLTLVMQTCAPLKDNIHKITLNINDSPVAISTLFPEFIGENCLTISSNAIGFKSITNNDEIVSILSAKSSQRYRIQSESICALSILVQEMIRRLRKHFTGNKNAVVISYTSSLPVAQLLEKVRLHFDARTKVTNYEDELNLLAAQFRLIQKRLISKYKDKNPTPLANLDMLLQDTYNANCELVTKLQDGYRELRLAQIALSCVLHLTHTLVAIHEQSVHVNNNSNVLGIATSGLSPYVSDLRSGGGGGFSQQQQQTWEDVTDTGLCYLLRTRLARSDKDRLRAPHSSFEEVRDISKLEKHISQVLDRLLSGSNVQEDSATTSGVIAEEDVTTDESKHREELHVEKHAAKELLPVGSRFAESSTRVLSARKSLLNKRQKVQIQDEQ